MTHTSEVLGVCLIAQQPQIQAGLESQGHLRSPLLWDSLRAVLCEGCKEGDASQSCSCIQWAARFYLPMSLLTS